MSHLNVRDPNLQRYLEPDKLVPLSGTIAELAKEHTPVIPLRSKRPVTSTTTSSPPCAMTNRRRLGPRRRHLGVYFKARQLYRFPFPFHRHDAFFRHSRPFRNRFPVPEGKTEGDITGYHCWAEFYLAGVGWVPVDASEAWKNPAKRDFFFGAHDTNAFSSPTAATSVSRPTRKATP